MDYKGEYFPEEELLDIEWTAARIAKAIFKGILYFIAIFIYLFFFFRFFTSCDPAMVEKTFLSPHAREVYESDPSDFPIYRINSTNTNSDGTVMLRRIIYAEKVSEVEIGVRFVVDKTAPGKTVEYRLTDSAGHEYDIVNRESMTRYNYGYERIAFGGVTLDLSANETLNPPQTEESSSSDLTVSEDEFDTEIRKGVVYTFSIYADGELIESFDFYSNLTPVTETAYK